MKKIIIANWKLNPLKLRDGQRLLDRLAQAKTRHAVVICPPAVYLPLLKTKFALGAQDIFWQENGAFTGEISGQMLAQFKTKYVLIGHSERRALGETDEQVNLKLKASLADKLTPIVCAGFGLARGDSEENTLVHLQHQLRADLHGIDSDDMKKIAVAYEPVWALSNGSDYLTHEIPKPDEISRAITTIRKNVSHLYGERAANKLRLLYGGSTNATTAADLLKIEGIDGLLVGGASLNYAEFSGIVEAAYQLQYAQTESTNG